MGRVFSNIMRFFSRKKEVMVVRERKKKTYIGFVKEIPRLKRACTINVISRGRTGLILYEMETSFVTLVEMLEPGLAVVHTENAYYVVIITTSSNVDNLFLGFSDVAPIRGEKLYAERVKKSDDDEMELVNCIVNPVRIMKISNVYVCYAKNGIFVFNTPFC